MEARVGIEPTNNGFADLYGVLIQYFTVSRPCGVRFWAQRPEPLRGPVNQGRVRVDLVVGVTQLQTTFPLIRGVYSGGSGGARLSIARRRWYYAHRNIYLLSSLARQKILKPPQGGFSV